MAQFDRFDIAEAHCVLEWDYNVGGWLRERPTNLRRMQSTGVQLHRMQFHPRADLGYSALTENAQEIYLDNVLKLDLPRDAEQNQRIREMFSPDWLKAKYPVVHADVFRAMH